MFCLQLCKAVLLTELPCAVCKSLTVFPLRGLSVLSVECSLSLRILNNRPYCSPHFRCFPEICPLILYIGKNSPSERKNLSSDTIHSYRSFLHSFRETKKYLKKSKNFSFKPSIFSYVRSEGQKSPRWTLKTEYTFVKTSVPVCESTSYRRTVRHDSHEER